MMEKDLCVFAWKKDWKDVPPKYLLIWNLNVWCRVFAWLFLFGVRADRILMLKLSYNCAFCITNKFGVNTKGSFVANIQKKQKTNKPNRENGANISYKIDF